MVMATENQTVIATKDQLEQRKPSLKRWFKHSIYFKQSKHYFKSADQQQIANAITQAEDGHRGEIQVIIEASLPSGYAYDFDTLQRARDLFAQYAVWDTERNSGLLIYLNLCERKLELVADRGINQAVDQDTWQRICEHMIDYFKQQQLTLGLCSGIVLLGEVLQKFYHEDEFDRDGNELSNLPKLL